MAIVQNPITGRSKNKFANAIFSTWNGLNVLRSKPLSVSNPNTVLQQNSRNKLSFMSKLAASLDETVRKGFKAVTQFMTPYNMFIKTNYSNVMSTLGVNSISNYDDFKIAKGILTPIAYDAQFITSVTEFNVDWNAVPLNSHSSDTDEVYAAIYDTTTKEFVVSITGAQRGDLSQNFEFPFPVVIAGNHAYLFTYNLMTQKASDSVHILIN